MSKKQVKAARLYNQQQPLYVLPATARAYGAMVKQMARGIAAVWHTSDPDIEHSVWKREARSALCAIGIVPPKKGRT